MTEHPTAPSDAPTGSLDELWSSWVASPGDQDAKAALVEAITQSPAHRRRHVGPRLDLT